MGKIDWSPPEISNDDRMAMKAVIDSGWMSEGKATEELEAALAKRIGCRHAIVMNNATSALLAALWGNGIGNGAEVVVPAYTFIASVNTPNAVGAKSVLCDSNPKTLNTEPEFMKQVLTENTRAIMPVDIAGMPIDMGAFEDFAKDNDLVLIEDGAEAIGASYRGRNVGNSGHATIFSFHMAKLITSIEGGCMATNDDALAEKVRMIKNHGTHKKEAKTNFFGFGLNFRTTDVQSALGLSQLLRLDHFLKRRNEVARIYSQELDGLVGMQQVPEYVSVHARMFFPIFVEASRRDAIDAALNRMGISTRICWPPAHMQPYHRRLFPDEKIPNSEMIGNTIIAIPMGNSTTDEEAKTVADAVKKAVGEN